MKRRFKIYDGNPLDDDGKPSAETDALIKSFERLVSEREYPSQWHSHMTQLFEDMGTHMAQHIKDRDDIYLEHGKGKREWYLTLEDMLREKDCSKLNEPWRRRRNR